MRPRTSNNDEPKKSSNSSFTTLEQAAVLAMATTGSVNADKEEKRNETPVSPVETQEVPASPVGIDPASPVQITTKAQFAKDLFFGSPLRTGLTFGAAALLASVGKTIIDCANGNCTMTAEEMQHMFHMANATLTTAAKAGITAGVDLVAPMVTGVGFAAMHAVANKMHAVANKESGLFGSKKSAENSVPTAVVSTESSESRSEVTPLLQPGAAPV